MTYKPINEKEREFLEAYDANKYPSMAVTVDSVIFGITKEEPDDYRKLAKQSLKVLLIKRNEYPYMDFYSLPGGFVGKNETMEDTLKRTLVNKTGLDDIYSEQLYTFSDIDRDPRMRVISCAYISLVDIDKITIFDGEWFDVENISKLDLAFDHNKIINDALYRIRGKINYTDIVFHLMPKEFTLTQLQEVYEIILGKKLLAAAFRRTINDKVLDTGKMTDNVGHRPSRIFIKKKE